MTRQSLLAFCLLSLVAEACSPAQAQETSTQEKVSVAANAVKIATNSNNLSDVADGGTTDLQSAIDNVMRVKLSTLLPRTTWNVVNKTSDAVYSGPGKTGKVAFSATGNGLQVLAGALAVAGQVHDDGRDETDNFCNPLSPMTYEIIADKILYVTSESQGSAVIEVADASKSQLVLTGAFGCGQLGIGRVSILTPAE